MKIYKIDNSNLNCSQVASNNIHRNVSNKSVLTQLDDVFIKNTSNITFTGNDDKKTVTTDNLVDALATTGLVGSAFLLSVATGIALAKNMDGKEIFQNSNGYACDTSELSLKSSQVIADGDDGIFKIKGTGIDMDAEKYHYADTTRGVYWNEDRSVDIDLLNNKYIDVKNGIFIDIPNGIASIVDDGVVKAIPMISFQGGLMPSPNPPMPPYSIPYDGNNPVVGAWEHIKDCINTLFGTHLSVGYMVDENYHKVPMKEYLAQKDMLNREMETAYHNGESYITAVPESSPFYAKFIDQGLLPIEAANSANTNILQSYIEQHNIPVNLESHGDTVTLSPPSFTIDTTTHPTHPPGTDNPDTTGGGTDTDDGGLDGIDYSTAF